MEGEKLIGMDLIGVPYTSAARPGGIATGIRVLREAGLADALGETQDAGDLDLLTGTGERGASGLLNEEALGRFVAATREAVARCLEAGRRPLLVGGDCPVILGALAACRDAGHSPGLLLVDGHEDAWPPGLSETGEASDSEVGIALGRVHGLPAPLGDVTPLLDPEAVAMLGPRDRRELDEAGVERLDGTVALLRDDAEVLAAGAEASAREALAILPAAFWLHVDLDVLSTADFPAADYLQPGGLAWRDLLEIAATALADTRCLGVSVVIYNPDLDPERTSAERVVRVVGELVARGD
jgi:arginase